MGKPNVAGAEKLVPKGIKQLFAGAVSKINDNGKGKKDYVLIITDVYIAYWIKGTAFEKTLYWNKVEKYDFNDTQIEIHFPPEGKAKVDKAIFEASNIGDINKIIVEHLAAVFSKSEFDKLELSRYGEHNPDPNNVRTRLILYLNNDKVSEDKYDPDFKKIIQSQLKTAKIESSKDLESVIYALTVASFIESIELPSDSKPYTLLKDMLPLPYLHILLSSEIGDDFEPFFDELKEKYGALRGITLRESQLQQNHIKKLVEVYEKTGFTSLALQNSVPLVQLPPLYDSISESLGSSLKMLNLDNTKGIELDELLPKITFIQSLSLVNCNIKISDVFNGITTTSVFTDLKMLNLSGNESGIIQNYLIPASLQRVDAANVKWETGSLVTFLKLFFDYNYIHGIKLNVSNGNANPTEWQNVFAYIETCEPIQLTELNWSGNIIIPQFYTFLQKCSILRVLRVNGCLEPSNLDEFGNAISQVPSLKELYIAGANNQTAGSGIGAFLAHLNGSLSLTLVDVHSQNLQHDGLMAVSDLLNANSSIATVNIDDNGITESKDLFEFFNGCAKAARAIAIDYPELTIAAINASGNDLAKIKIRIDAIHKGTATVEEVAATEEKKDEEAEGEDDKKGKKKDTKKKKEPKKKGKGKDEPKEEKIVAPFEVYRLEQTEEFPLFLSDAVISGFEETVAAKAIYVPPQPVHVSSSESDKKLSNHPADGFGQPPNSNQHKAKGSDSSSSFSDEPKKQNNDQKKPLQKKPSKKFTDSESDDDDQKNQKKKPSKKFTDSESDDDDQKKQKKKPLSPQPAKKKAVRGNSSDDYDDEPLPPKGKKASAKKASKKFVDSDDDSEDGPLPPKGKKASAKKTSKKFVDSSADDSYEDEPPNNKKGANINKNKKNSQKFGDSSDSFEGPPKKKSKKSQVSDDSDEQRPGQKKKQPYQSSSDDEREPPMKKVSQKKASDNNRRRPVSSDSDDQPPAKKIQNNKRRPNSSSSDDEPQPINKKSQNKKIQQKQPSDSDSDNNRRSPQKNSKRALPSDDSSDEIPRRSSKKALPSSSSSSDEKNDSNRRSPKRHGSQLIIQKGNDARLKKSPLAKTMKNLKRQSVMSSDSDSYDNAPASPKSPQTNQKLSFVAAAPKPKKDQYEQPEWKFPEQLDEKFDVKPVYHKLQQQFALSVLRDSI